MKSKTAFIALICIIGLLSFSEQKHLEIPLVENNGYGSFHPNFVSLSPYTNNGNNPWKGTFLKISGIPEAWTDIKYGDIETNIYQNVYQNYFLGNITQDLFNGLKKTWAWDPDTLLFSKKPLKTKIAFAYGKDSTGNMRIIIDANNNLDLSDDECFTPYIKSTIKSDIKDSIALQNAINVTFEKYINNKTVLETAPLFISYNSINKRFIYNFPQHLTANFNDEKLEICSHGFTNLSYENPSIGLNKNKSNNEEVFNNENLILKNEFIKIKENRYRFIGINQNKLILEQINLPENELVSSQIGYKSHSFKGKNYITDSQIASNDLRGKYVLLNFWAVWCGACRQDIPILKKLYEKTDRAKFEIIGIVGDSPLNMLQKIIEKDSITWPQILSTDINKIKEEFGTFGYPHTFLLNKEGIIIAKDIRGEKLEEKILKLLNE